jgi:hypothetical protein
MSNTDRWKPVLNEKYYFIDSLGETVCSYWYDSSREQTLYNRGNCFATAEEAEEVAKIWKRLLNKHHKNENLNWGSSSELMGLFVDALKNIGGLSANPETAKLPDWCKVNAWVFDSNNGYGEIISIKEDRSSCYIVFDGGEGDFVPEDFTKFKQARPCPYSPTEMESLVGKVLNHDTGSYLVTAFENRWNQVKIESVWRDADELMKVWTWFDGKPCGKLVHKEGNDWIE